MWGPSSPNKKFNRYTFCSSEIRHETEETSPIKVYFVYSKHIINAIFFVATIRQPAKTVGCNSKAMPTKRHCLLCHYGVTSLHCEWEVAIDSMPRLLQLRSPSPSSLSYSTVYKYPQRLRVVLSIERELLDLYHTLHTNKKVNVIYFIKISRTVCLPFQPAHWFLLLTYSFILVLFNDTFG